MALALDGLRVVDADTHLTEAHDRGPIGRPPPTARAGWQPPVKRRHRRWPWDSGLRSHTGLELSRGQSAPRSEVSSVRFAHHQSPVFLIVDHQGSWLARPTDGRSI